MKRITSKPRANWKDLAEHYKFDFHTMYGEPYWDESAYYQFSLKQIEDDLEDPTEEIHQMCLEVVDKVCRDEYWLKKFMIPEAHWQYVLDSWQKGEHSLYSRLDFAYDGNGPAKLYENNADTPTSVYETAFWQWIWLEDLMQSQDIPAHSDQFNLLQDQLIQRFHQLSAKHANKTLYFACCQDSIEDRGTVQYMEDCAKDAGLETKFIHVEEIGLSTCGQFMDLQDQQIEWIFKLYPWEFMLRESYASALAQADCTWLEPAWKSILSNKALLPMLWKLFPNHPNLLESYFSDDSSFSPDEQAKVRIEIRNDVSTRSNIRAYGGADIAVYRVEHPIQFLTAQKNIHRIQTDYDYQPKGMVSNALSYVWDNFYKESRMAWQDILSDQIRETALQISPAFRQKDPYSYRTQFKKYKQFRKIKGFKLIDTFRYPITDAAPIPPQKIKMAGSSSPFVASQAGNIYVPLGKLKSGLYLVEAVIGDHRANTLVFVSHSVLVSKISGTEIFLWSVDKSNGQPIADTNVLVTDGIGVLKKGRTDKQGMARLKLKTPDLAYLIGQDQEGGGCSFRRTITITVKSTQRRFMHSQIDHYISREIRSR